jgi:uncharacterized protein (DUF2141 family)
VRDTAGNPIEHADISLDTHDVRANSDDKGFFHIEKVSAGTYAVNVRRLGYFPRSETVVVTDAGGSVAFTLIIVPAKLPTVVTSAVRGGLSGVVEDSVHGILPDAHIAVLGADADATTDSAGAFFVDVKPGRYAVRVDHDGFATRIVSVTIPKDSGRQILVGLAKTSRAAAARQSTMLENLRRRMMMRTSATSKILTREDILRSDADDMASLVSFGAGYAVNDGCFASLNGDPARSRPISSIDPTDVEMLEVYAAGAPRSDGRSRQSSRPGDPRRCPVIMAWLRP